MTPSRSVEAIIQTGEDQWLVLDNPARIVEAVSPGDVRPAVAEVERLTRDASYFAAGYLAYEAGAAFGLQASHADGSLPLAWFALFEPDHVHAVGELPGAGTYDLGPLTPSIDRPVFDEALARIKQHLRDGDTYQVNFTFRMRGGFQGDPRALFADLVRAQRGRYSMFLQTGDHAICSASPELFFALDGLNVSARPMKGTSPRGRTLDEDRALREELCASAKQRAENVMIVDMMRNDLGKIAEVGSVHAPELFTAERYPNVWQLTSLVTARSRASLEDILAAVHPSASVTGAPKVRTMELLDALEQEPRGVYTGAIGYVRPDGDARFSVAIRTAVVSHADNRVEFGVGSGIVWDSQPDAEYDECLLKGAVLGRRASPFDLLETLAWYPQGGVAQDGFVLLARHLSRLRDSAEYFNYALDERAVRAALDAAVIGAAGPLRLRLLVSRNGAVRVEQQPLAVWSGGNMRVGLASAPIDASDPFFFHKTTNRGAYERARLPGVDDVILWNANGQITEATTANIAIELADGSIVTPPVHCGLLAGTFRADAIARGRMKERVVSVEECRASRRMWLLNSVQGEREAVLVGDEDAR